MLELEPGNPQAFERLKQILNSVERWGELEQLYRGALETTQRASARAELLQEVAVVAEEMIGDDLKAIGYQEQILDIDPLHTLSLFDLGQVQMATKRYPDALAFAAAFRAALELAGAQADAPFAVQPTGIPPEQTPLDAPNPTRGCAPSRKRMRGSARNSRELLFRTPATTSYPRDKASSTRKLPMNPL